MNDNNSSLTKKIPDVQKALKEAKIDGWLFYDFRRSNDLALNFLEIPEHVMLTRRFFYWIPQKGEPVKIVSAIEGNVLDILPGEKKLYRTWEQLNGVLQETLQASRNVAMEYSPDNGVPYISKVDAGIIEKIRHFGLEVVSSGDLLQKYTSVLSLEQYESLKEAASVLNRAVEEVWALIGERVSQGLLINEYEVQQFILDIFEREGCVAEEPPIVAINAHAADPHYMPNATGSASISLGDWVLIDLSCKKRSHRSIYADITRVGVVAKEATSRQEAIFSIVRKAQKAATELVTARFNEGVPLMGSEVDAACRQVIEQAGFGNFFIHRTGHNIGERVHGNGAHLDNYETQDKRQLIPGTCFTIEPGIYLPGEFGVRLEYDIYVHINGGTEILGGVQEKIALLLNA